MKINRLDGGIKRAVLAGLSLSVALPLGAHAQSQTEELDTVTVSADAETSATAPLTSFAPTNSGTSTRTNTAITQTPQSLNIVGQKQIQATGADSLMSALQYTPGVAVGNNDDDMWESVYIRGFKSRRAFRDGMKYQVDAWDGRQEMYNVERIEVSKGASSFTFAGDEPGGAINTISKRPTAEPLREIGFSLGQYNDKKLMMDFSDNVSADGDVKYRLVGVARGKDSFIDHVDSNRFFLAPSLSWRISDATNLTILAEIQRDKVVPLEYGIPREAALLDNPNGSIAPSTFVGEPGVDKAKIRRAALGYELNHAFSDTLSFTHKARYFDAGIDVTYMDNKGLKDDNRTLSRPTATTMDRNSKQFTTDTFISADIAQGALLHKAVFGFDYSYDRMYAERYTIPVTNGDLDIFNPVYGDAVLGKPEFHQRGSRIEKLVQAGIYAQDQIEWNDWTFTLGGRYGYAQWGEKPLDGSKSYELQSTNALTGRAGVTYEFANGIAPFFSYSQSFKPQGGKDKAGKRFDPTEGEQFEIGVRYQPRKDILLSAVAYELTKSNVLTPDLTDREYRVQTGEVTTKGIELEAQAQITDDFSLVAAYTRTKTEVTQSNNADEIGQPLKDMPKSQASLWADWRLTALSMPNATFGIGVRHVGQTDNLSYNVPSYTVVDAALRYQYQNWHVALEAKNLADKAYISSCAYACAYGEPRTVMATVKYQF